MQETLTGCTQPTPKEASREPAHAHYTAQLSNCGATTWGTPGL